MNSYNDLHKTLDGLLDNFSLETVITTARFLQAHRNRDIHARWRQVHDLYEQGNTFAEIATQMGISKQRVKRQYNIGLARKNYSELATGEHPIEALDLPVRVYNSMVRAGIRSVEQVVKFVNSERQLRGLGEGARYELVTKLQEKHFL
jgi:DNA-directed RNA polymerase alpha subunit